MTLVHFILLIGPLIFFHELGHFIFAKLFGVKVLRFSLGFGPRLAGFTRGETEYRLSWLPLGGYVKMLGEDPTDTIRPEDRGRALQQKPLWQRFVIVFAGPAFNLILPVFIYFALLSGQTTLDPPVIGKVFAGLPAAEAGIQAGDRVVAIDGEPIRYWEEMRRVVRASPGKALRFTIEREGRRIERYITPREYRYLGPLRLVRRDGLIGVTKTYQLAQIGITGPDTPAARAGLRAGDLVTSVNGRPVTLWVDLERILARNRGEALHVSYLRPGRDLSGFVRLFPLVPGRALITPRPVTVGGRTRYETGIANGETFVRSVVPGSPAARIGLRPGDRIVAIDGEPVRYWERVQVAFDARPDAEHTVTWIAYGGGRRQAKVRMARETWRDEYYQDRQSYLFGAENPLVVRTPEPVPIEGRLTRAAVESVRRTGEIVAFIGMSFVQLVRGALPLDNLGGPLMLAKTASVAAGKGWDYFIGIMALISISLGILNLLPIPILDGGHILFFALEAIKRRPLSLRAREIASYVGLLLLISLMVLAFRNDIMRYWLK